MTATSEVPKRRRRWALRLGLAALSGLACLVALLFAIPWIVHVPWIHRQLVTQANRIMAPGTVRFDRLSVSWFRPTEIQGLVLGDPQGDDIVISPRAHFDWSLREIFLTQPATATLTLDKAHVDIERTADGKVDLLEALQAILKDEPERTFLVRVVDGTLRFRQAGLAEPFLADRANIDLDLTAFPQPIAWRLALERARGNAPPGQVKIQGSMSRKKRENGLPTELQLSIRGEQWPWKFSVPQLSATGSFAGTIDVAEKEDESTLAGDVHLMDLQASGSALSGDELRLPSVSAAWKVSMRNGSWSAQRLDVSSPLGEIKASGTFPPAKDQGLHVSGSLDLAALAGQIPRTLRLRQDLRVQQGSAELRAEIAGDLAGGGQTISAEARVTGLTARQGQSTLVLRDPLSLAAKLHRQTDGLTLEKLDVQTPFLTATGRGDLDRGITVAATVDLGGATQRVREWVDLGRLDLAGQGKIDARYQRTANRFDASAIAEFKGLKFSGLPAVESFKRNRLASAITVRGGADPSGLPEVLHDLSLTAKSDAEDITLGAKRDRTTQQLAANLKGRTQAVLGGKKHTVEAALHSRWSDQEVTIDQVLITLTPVVGPGGQFLPSDPARWSGKGRYDIGRDELTILADTGAAGAVPLALAPKQIRAGGLRAREASWLEVTLAGELAALLPPTNPDQTRLTGELSGLLQGRQNQDGWDFGAQVQLQKLARVDATGARRAFADEAGASLRGRLGKKLERLDFSELAIVTPYGRAEGAGSVLDVASEPRFDLKGMLSPDWKALTRLMAARIEPGASISGSPRAWRISGKVPKAGGPDLLASLSGELGVNLEQVDVFGMRLGRAPIVVRVQEGVVRIDPIDSILNAGRLHLEPEVIKDKQGGNWLHLGTASGLHDAVVNDEVSHRVLAYAAPVLDQATRVRGRVSLALADAIVPLDAGPDAQARINGDVLFDAVEFMPGPLADQLIGIFRQERRPLLVLRDPVSIRIVGRRIYQQGLVIPLGNVAAIGIEGWIDFDQKMNMLASFAMLPPRQNIPVLSSLLASTKFQVPITGTLKNPKLDGGAIAERFKNMGTNMLNALVDMGANGLGRILRGAPNPNPARPRELFRPFSRPGEKVPPPPAPDAKADDAVDKASGTSRELTPEERRLLREQRKALRLEKKAERKLRRALPPE
jgi:translocation and assembly module TamB